MGAPSTEFHDLTPQSLTKIFSFLPAKDCARAACVQRLWRDSIADDLLWKGHLHDSFLKTEPVDPSAQQISTYRSAYVAWMREFGQHPELAKRCVKAWTDIKGWVAVNHPEISASLGPGASPQAIAQAEASLGHALPAALKVIYRLCNGQDLKIDACMQARTEVDQEDIPLMASIFHGLFGGYSFYDHMVCTRMFPLERAVQWTAHLRLQRRPHLIFAASFNLAKVFYVDLISGNLYVLRTGPGQLSAVPAGEPDLQDGVLRWIEEYGRRLTSGTYEVALLNDAYTMSRGICLFPLQPPVMAEEVTRGVKVRATSLYAPEMSRGQQHTFTYSVRYSLLPTEEQPQHWPATAGPVHVITSCQLMSRHWLIRDAEGRLVDEVQGEGVIGKFPILTPGQEEFVYQSCSQQKQAKGSMEGTFKFVEGKITSRTGPEWDVICPRFMLEIPEYIY